MALLNDPVNAINGVVRGVPTTVPILGTGPCLQIRLRFLPPRRILYRRRMIRQGRAPDAVPSADLACLVADTPNAPMAIPKLRSLLLWPPIAGPKRAYLDRPHDDRAGHDRRAGPAPPAGATQPRR
jgi:hypothetical protein